MNNNKPQLYKIRIFEFNNLLKADQTIHYIPLYISYEVLNFISPNNSNIKLIISASAMKGRPYMT